jgi:ABC-type long-subunit fatty acid transport system fused permease/ATPase subunit
MMFKSLFQKNKLYIIGAVIGAISGFAYWKFIGCQSGTCKITSSPLNSTMYFAILGALTFSLFKKEK